MRGILTAVLLALAVSACGSYGGGSAPAPAGGGAATAAPRASDAAKTPAPTGDPNVDNYGY